MKFVRLGPNDSKKYDELIETLPAFVKIHSPNCGHCVNMKEAWDALEKSSDIKHYDIAIIEVHEGATNNISSPSGQIDQGLPTIRAVQLNGKKWKEYEGDRSVEDMVSFIEENFNNRFMSGGASMSGDTMMYGGAKNMHSRNRSSRNRSSRNRSSRNRTINQTKRKVNGIRHMMGTRRIMGTRRMMETRRKMERRRMMDAKRMMAINRMMGTNRMMGPKRKMGTKRKSKRKSYSKSKRSI
jgi:uncharacterized protein YdaT